MNPPLGSLYKYFVLMIFPALLKLMRIFQSMLYLDFLYNFLQMRRMVNLVIEMDYILGDWKKIKGLKEIAISSAYTHTHLPLSYTS